MPTTNEFKVDPSQRRPETRRQCPHCDYVCATNAKLKIHSIVHTNRRDFLCDKCPMAFKSKKNLAAHQRIHLSPAIKNASNRTQTCEKSKRDIGKFDLNVSSVILLQKENALSPITWWNTLTNAITHAMFVQKNSKERHICGNISVIILIISRGSVDKSKLRASNHPPETSFESNSNNETITATHGSVVSQHQRRTKTRR